MSKAFIIFGILAVIVSYSVSNIIGSGTDTLEPDSYITFNSDIELNTINVQVDFDDSSDKIFVSKNLIVSEEDNKLKIKMPNTFTFDSKSPRIVIGTKKRLRKLVINSTNTSLKGDFETGILEINGTLISLNGNIKAKNINLDGTVANINGKIDAQSFIFKGTTLNIESDLKNVEIMEMNATTINAKIKYTDTWSGMRYIRSKGVTGYIDILVDKEMSDNINIIDDGISLRTNLNYF